VEKINFFWIPGHCEDDVNERADSQAKQSIKEGRNSQVLLLVENQKVHWKKKTKRSFTISVKTPKGRKKKTTLKAITTMARLRRFAS
jgi:hypothetical protein